MVFLVRLLKTSCSAALIFLLISGACAEPLPLKLFADLPQFDGPTLSPDGRYLAIKAYRDGRYIVIIYDLENIDGAEPMIMETDPWSVNDLQWANDDRILITVVHRLRAAQINRGGRYRGASYAQQLTAFDVDGSNSLVFVERKGASSTRYLGDDIVNFLPDDPENVLVRWFWDSPRMPRLYKMNVYTAELKLVQSGKSGVQSWLLDGSGEVRFGSGIGGRELKAYHRPVGKKKWQLLYKKPAKEGWVFQADMIDTSDPDIAWVRSNFNADTIGLYKYRLSTASFIEEIYRHPEFDLGEVIFNRQRTEIEGIDFFNNVMKTHWISAIQSEILKKVEARLPGFRLSISSKSRSNERWVIHAWSSDRPGRYYLYEPELDRLQLFAYRRPELEGKQLPAKRVMTYKARDGLEIEAFLSLPPDVDYPPPAPLPTIVMPYAGSPADQAGFDPLVQFLANQGYAVMQMNPRGHIGYGKQFAMAGVGQYGLAIQDDITDGTQWLTENGVADQDRICIVGQFLGGYAALMGAVRTPELFQCAVSLNGISDLKVFMGRNERFIFGWAVNNAFEIEGNATLLQKYAPVRQAKKINIPVLLAHSTHDSVVNFDQSKNMAKALEKADKDYRFVPLEGGNSDLSHGKERAEFFQALQYFLNENLH